MKIGEMARQIESTHALLESIAFQMNMKNGDRRLGVSACLRCGAVSLILLVICCLYEPELS